MVAGYIENHGWERPREIIGDLETVPRKKIDCKGDLLEELDAAAVIDRAPRPVRRVACAPVDGLLCSCGPPLVTLHILDGSSIDFLFDGYTRSPD